VDYGSAVVLKNKKDKRFYQIGVTVSKFVKQQVMRFARVSHYIEWIKDTVLNNADQVDLE
jgi:hypothetical protein